MDSNNHPLLHKLNEQQCNAIISRPGPILVLAGPGSGKTRVLTHRIAWMLQEQEIAAWNILAVTFTNKAAREMRTRLDNMVGHNVAQYMTVGTFHAICSRILRREAEHIGLDNNYLIFDTDDQLSVMKEVVKDLGLDDKQYRPRSLLGGISQAKNELIEPVDYPISTYYDEIVSRAYSRYQDILRRSNGVDFDDLLMETVRLFRTQPEVLQKYQERHQHILVDEFQDTNMAQYVLLRLLTHEQRSIFVVADEDQSIYSWRGADARNIQRLRADYPEIKEYLLEENYRSTQVILDAAHSVIQENFNRTPKQLFTRKEGGNRIMLHEAYDEREEADYVAREIKQLLRGDYTPSDIAIMYRTNAQSRALEETLITYNIPYRLIGATRFYSRKEIKDVLAYLRLAQNPDDDVSFQRVINVPTRGIGARTLGKVIEYAKAIQTSYYQAALSLIQQGGLSKRANNALQAFVTLATMWHQSYTTLDVTTLMDNILADTNYERFLRDRTEEGESRWENVMALRAVAADFPDKPLVEFLTDVALV
ncbi:MAG: UvrD-helicase domain-containing protein, partial [Anaerolineae bacterium]|nr:UvrD-helicase domain-containing protein [Anaerolineae bacterium]